MTFGKRGAINCSADFERRKAWAVKSQTERNEERQWNARDRRNKDAILGEPERKRDHVTTKIYVEGIASYVVLGVCFFFIAWAVLRYVTDLFSAVSNILTAVGG